jgi:hypothetical protein
MARSRRPGTSDRTVVQEAIAESERLFARR